MRYLLYLLKTTLLLVLFSQAACKKEEEPTVTEEAQPFADFSTDKSEYMAGDNIHLVNISTNATRFIWTFPDGSTGKSRDADYPTAEALGAQSLTFKLEAYSEKSTKSDHVVKIIKVKPAEGQLVFFTYNFNHVGANADVFVDGILYTQITLNSSGGMPVCGQAGYPTIQLPVGPHLINVTRNGFSVGSANLTISKTTCSVMQI